MKKRNTIYKELVYKKNDKLDIFFSLYKNNIKGFYLTKQTYFISLKIASIIQIYKLAYLFYHTY